MMRAYHNDPELKATYLSRVRAHRAADEIIHAEDVEWPEAFLSAIPVGADLSGVWPAFVVRLLGDPTYGVLRHVAHPNWQEQRAAIETVLHLYEAGIPPTARAAEATTRAAEAAWAAWAAEAAGDAEAAAWDAEAAACDTEAAAWAAEDAAKPKAWAAAAAWTAALAATRTTNATA